MNVNFILCNIVDLICKIYYFERDTSRWGTSTYEIFSTRNIKRNHGLYDLFWIRRLRDEIATNWIKVTNPTHRLVMLFRTKVYLKKKQCQQYSFSNTNIGTTSLLSISSHLVLDSLLAAKYIIVNFFLDENDSRSCYWLNSSNSNAIFCSPFASALALLHNRFLKPFGSI